MNVACQPRKRNLFAIITSYLGGVPVFCAGAGGLPTACWFPCHGGYFVKRGLHMNAPISSGLKTTFLVHAIIAVLFGLGYLLIPATVGAWYGFSATDPAVWEVWRVLGAALIGFAMASWWGYRASDWSQVAIVVQMEIVWTVLGALATIWALVAGLFPVMGWVNVVLLVIFAVAFGYFYSRKS